MYPSDNNIQFFKSFLNKQQVIQLIKKLGILSGSVDTIDDLPPAEDHKGQVWLVETDTSGMFSPSNAGFYTSNGTVWTKIPIEFDVSNKVDKINITPFAKGSATKTISINVNEQGQVVSSSEYNLESGNIVETTNLFYTNERVDDRIDALLQVGTGLTKSYDDIINILIIGLNPSLTSLSQTGNTSNKIAYTTNIDTWAETDLTAFGRALIANPNASDTRDDLELGINNDVSFQSVSTDYIDFDTTFSGAMQEGRVAWDGVSGTLQVGLGGGSILQMGQEVMYYAKASGNILNGDVCQFAGAQGDHILVKKAVPSEINANPFLLIGIATQNISNGSFGYVTHFGKVNDTYTYSWVEGDILYFDFVNGNLTNIEPTPPTRKIIVAAVIKEQTDGNDNGILLTRLSWGDDIHDLNDVDISNLSNNDILAYDSTTATWTNRNAANIAGIIQGSIDHGSISGLGDDDHTQYYNLTRINTWLTTKTTSNLAEGTNLYFTNARAQNALAGLYEVPLTFGTGLTRSTNAITVNSDQNITRLSNLTTNGFIKTISNNGTLSIDTNTYLTDNQTITLSGDVGGSGTTSITATIANNAVSNAKMATMSNNTIKGNKSGSTGVPSDLALSDIVEATSSVLTITNGSKTVVGSSNLSIQVKQASSSQAGYLSSADWSTFNNKQAALGYTPINKVGDTMTGYLTLNADPTSSLHATTKQYVDALITGITWKNAVEVATTSNITLSGEQTIDGIAIVSGERVLVKDQTNQTQNGIYICASSSWSRASDADSGAELWGAAVYVKNGSTNGETQWANSNTSSITIGSTNITFGQIGGANLYLAGSGLSLTGSTFSVANSGITTAMVANSNITYSKIQNVSATNKLLGRSSAGAGVVEEISTIPSAILGGSTLFVGTTSIALNRSSAAQSLTGITSIDGHLTLTNTGKTGNIGYITPSSQASWANYPVGLGTMISSGKSANGAPSDDFQYFFKIANRDTSGGWSGICLNMSDGSFYTGKSDTSSSYATWNKLARVSGSDAIVANVSTASSKVFEAKGGANALALVPQSGLLTGLGVGYTRAGILAKGVAGTERIVMDVDTWNGGGGEEDMKNIRFYSQGNVLMRYNTTGLYVGGNNSTTARIEAAAGTTSIPPLKLNSGSDLTTGQTGAFEFGSSRLTFTPSGTTRKRVALLNDVTPANGQIPIGNGTDFTVANITGTANQVNVANGIGTITLSLPQNINTTSSPTFNALTLNGNLSAANFSGSSSGINTGNQTVTGTANQVNVANGSTNPILSLPQDIDTAAAAKFASLKLGVSANKGGNILSLSGSQNFQFTNHDLSWNIYWDNAASNWKYNGNSFGGSMKVSNTGIFEFSLANLNSSGADAVATIAATFGFGYDKYFYINGTNVLTERQAGILNPTGGTTIDSQARTAIGSILTAMRNHGLIN